MNCRVEGHLVSTRSAGQTLGAVKTRNVAMMDRAAPDQDLPYPEPVATVEKARIKPLDEGTRSEQPAERNRSMSRSPFSDGALHGPGHKKPERQLAFPRLP